MWFHWLVAVIVLEFCWYAWGENADLAVPAAVLTVASDVGTDCRFNGGQRCEEIMQI